MEFIFELICEILLEVVIEVVVELGLHKVVSPLKSAALGNPFFAGLSYLFFGVAAGAVSLMLFPRLFLTADWSRLLNLALTPIAAGFSMSALGAWRQRRQQNLIRLDRFSYGALFALAMALVRYFWAR